MFIGLVYSHAIIFIYCSCYSFDKNFMSIDQL